MDNRMSEYDLDIRESCKLDCKSYGKLESGTNS